MTGTVVVTGDPPSPNTVLIVPYRTFEPDVITVTAGTTASQPGLWDSPILRRGQSYGHRFTQPGTYDYICGLHPEMKGEIVVTGTASGGSATPTPTAAATATAQPSTGRSTPGPSPGGSAAVYLPAITRSRSPGW